MVKYGKIYSSDKYILEWKDLKNGFIRNAAMKSLFLVGPTSAKYSNKFV